MKNIILSLAWIAGTLSATTTSAQADVPADVKSIVSMNLEDAQMHLQGNGYEIAGSNFMNKTELWWNETDKVCISLKFEKGKEHKVASVEPGDAEKCMSGVAAARAVWEKYHDGAAPVSTPDIDKKRQELTGKGYVVSYWIEDVAPGRSSEYWKNAADGCKHIVWNTQDKGNVSIGDCDAEYANNPAPKK